MATFFNEGLLLMGQKPRKKNRTYSSVINRRFRGHFGVCPLICYRIWHKLYAKLYIVYNGSGRPKHLLWALMHLKLYNSEEVNSAIAGVDEKTFQKYTWTIIDLISDFNVVSVTIQKLLSRSVTK